VTNSHSPVLLRLQLSLRLRAIRTGKKLRADQTARAVGWDPSKLSRIETGKIVVPIDDVMDLLAYYEIPIEEQVPILQMARAARKRGWWHQYEFVTKSLATYVGLEDAATVIKDFQLNLVPGLLQTEEYMRALFENAGAKVPVDEVDRRILARQARQDILERVDAPHLFFVLHEAGLRQQVGGEKVMERQLMRLIEAAQQPRVCLQILTYDAGAYAAMDGAFILLELPDLDNYTCVCIPRTVGCDYLEDPGDVRTYKLGFDYLRGSSLSPAHSLDFLRRLAVERAEA
jgi:transcriptional regulator with XRE-family HTH domain